ncbi:hypothetical protein NtRootA4_25600 [Arthrobacter sp. NtRootA4]|nr:hypothetical protein NtRootA2_27780 [Arthrobacter sp. NtRootA2]BCW15581.1 hypothetical protein NtRootA4_25600 [Arthrobacter sp. NtRootA4]BCW23915.1 hypothetical protein NtRootC7_27820 [Arthrobacter sp. NtRootC7]BCW28183.1 hypothetical protein NtRootC45_27830 [Arthrobacter sp. NtRootC45]BCW32453.1 hypothetical protein NtRootD5_27840 [Arthrobacter sp. NtRootD5]
MPPESTCGTARAWLLHCRKRRGLYHHNGRLSHSIYLPGITKGRGKDTAVPKGYALR